MKVLIVGCERSGTSAVAQLLAAYSNTSVLDDPPEAWYAYMSHVHSGRGLPLKLIAALYRFPVVKVPGFATILPYLCRVHPRPFSVLYIVRDPRDVVCSVRERLDNGFTGIFLDTTWFRKWIPCETVPLENSCAAIACRWRVYLERASEFATRYERIRFQRYEDFADARSDTIEQLASWCGLTGDRANIAKAEGKQFRKKWSARIAGRNRWLSELNPADVKTVERICEVLMKRYDYPLANGNPS